MTMAERLLSRSSGGRFSGCVSLDCLCVRVWEDRVDLVLVLARVWVGRCTRSRSLLCFAAGFLEEEREVDSAIRMLSVGTVVSAFFFGEFLVKKLGRTIETSVVRVAELI